MTAKERLKYWEAWERQRLIIERKYKAKIRKVLLNRVKEVQAAIKLGGVEYGKQSLNFDLLNTELVNIYIQIYKETSIRFANITYRELRLDVRKGASFGFNEEWAREAARFLAIEGIPLISTVTGNMREWILAVIGQAIGEGLELSLSMDDLIDMIIGRVGNYMEEKSRYWAERIARTETVRGANYGAMQGARKHDFLVKKVWIAADDKRTRDAHRELDNQVRDFDEPFENYEQIRFPGDPGGHIDGYQDIPTTSPQNTINCRCAVAFEAQRDSNGKVIRK